MSPTERTSWKPFLAASVQSAGILNDHEVENLPLIVRDKEHMSKMHSFDW